MLCVSINNCLASDENMKQIVVFTNLVFDKIFERT